MASAIKKGPNQLRIIGGEWRGRKLRFPDAPNLRPTPDRVRETIFNWLMPVMHGARCLDLFAGSGALGLEALSRGAASSTFVDSHAKASQAIKSHLDMLNASDKAEVLQMDAAKYLQKEAVAFDVVFLDPPYQSDFMASVIPLLENNGWLAPGAMLYLEIESRKVLPELPSSWQKLKEKSAGDVSYYLFQRN
jgi:16S rRNA (guanine966-N2)-methyltransferase